MKRAVLVLVLSTPWVCAQTPTSTSDRIDRVCRAKRVEFSSNFISCEGFDTGYTPLSASYQPKATGPMVSSPESVNAHNIGTNYINHFPAIQGTKDVMDDDYDYRDPETGVVKREAGYPLAYRFANMVAPGMGAPPEVLHWLQAGTEKNKVTGEPENTGYLFPLKNNPSADSSDGVCGTWSRWSVDPKVMKNLENITRGVTCNGVPLTLGEIKEVYVSLYGDAVPSENDAWYHQRRAGQKATEHSNDPSEVSNVMDANIGLAKLGLLGGKVDGPKTDKDLDPGELFDQFKQAIQEGRGASFNRDFGRQVWNQPIAAMVETLYKGRASDGPVSIGQILSMADLKPASADQQDTYQKLVEVEKSLVLRFAAGESLQGSELQGLSAFTPSGTSLKTRAQQANAFAKVKEAYLTRSQKLVPREGGALATVLKDLTFVYGEESKFASMDKDKTKQRSYRVASVIDKSDPKRKIKSVWNPPTIPVSQLCANSRRLDARQDGSGILGYSGINAKKLCDERKEDFDVFDMAPAPSYLTFFRRESRPYSDSEGQKKQKALEWFEEMLSKCEVFDHAADFATLFEKCELRNSIPTSELDPDDGKIHNRRRELLALFDKSEFLEDGWLKQHVCKSAGVLGLPELVQTLRAKRPGICQ